MMKVCSMSPQNIVDSKPAFNHDGFFVDGFYDIDISYS